MTTDTAAKKDIQKLQRAFIDGLEDVKAQDIVVFNTEHLSPLFERIMIASGTSNRQTKALAASVRDAVREAGFPKPRMEGEENGEWIIVDCGQAVVHVMQPVIRQYYHLEDLWGDTPVRLKFGADKPKAVAPKASASAKPATGIKRSSAAKKGVMQAFPSKAQVKKSAAKKAASGKAPAKSTGKATAKKAVQNAPKPASAKSPAAKAAARKAAQGKS
jgi:ribosome-associated protein